MGTRADFYVGTGPKAEWLGSVAWDGYAWAKSDKCALRQAQTEAEFRAAVAEILKREDATKPEHGWPWPWKTSATTDYTYYFFRRKARVKCFSGNWPDMTARQNVTFGARSGRTPS